MRERDHPNLTYQGRRENPMASSPSRMKLGVFSINTEGGGAVTNAPERLRGDDWVHNLEIARLADGSGFEAIIPSGRWRGFGEGRDIGGINYETYAWAAGVSALTTRIAVLSTSHVTTVHPLFAAKQATTIDHIGGGRFGLNILCGWYGREMRMFGKNVLEHDRRYDYAEEWLAIVRKVWEAETAFDFNGVYFDLEQVVAKPKPLNLPYLINAGSSRRGKEFCARHCDAAFLLLDHLEGDDAVKAQIGSYKDLARREFGRDIKIWCYGYVVQAETERSALDRLDYYANEMGDDEGCSLIMSELGMRTTGMTAAQADRYRLQLKAGFLGLPFVGTPEMIVDQFQRYHDLGVDGVALSWLDYHSGIRSFIDRTLPLLEQAGLRRPFGASCF